MSGSWHPHGHWHYSTNCRLYRIQVVEQYDLTGTTKECSKLCDVLFQAPGDGLEMHFSLHSSSGQPGCYPLSCWSMDSVAKPCMLRTCCIPTRTAISAVCMHMLFWMEGWPTTSQTRARPKSHGADGWYACLYWRLPTCGFGPILRGVLSVKSFQ